MKKLAVILLGLSLAGCAYFQNPINRNRLEVITDSYGIAQSAAVEYRTLCLAGTLPAGQKGCRSNIGKIQAYDRAAVSSLSNANTFLKNNPNSDATSAIAAAEASVSAFKSATAAYGAR